MNTSSFTLFMLYSMSHYRLAVFQLCSPAPLISEVPCHWFQWKTAWTFKPYKLKCTFIIIKPTIPTEHSSKQSRSPLNASYQFRTALHSLYLMWFNSKQFQEQCKALPNFFLLDVFSVFGSATLHNSPPNTHCIIKGVGQSDIGHSLCCDLIGWWCYTSDARNNFHFGSGLLNHKSHHH